MLTDTPSPGRVRRDEYLHPRDNAENERNGTAENSAFPMDLSKGFEIGRKILESHCFPTADNTSTDCSSASGPDSWDAPSSLPPLKPGEGPPGELYEIITEKIAIPVDRTVFGECSNPRSAKRCRKLQLGAKVLCENPPKKKKHRGGAIKFYDDVESNRKVSKRGESLVISSTLQPQRDFFNLPDEIHFSLPFFGKSAAFQIWDDEKENSDGGEALFRRVDPGDIPLISNRFWLEVELGRGSFACVLAGWDRLTQKRVAIKVDHPKKPRATRRSKKFLKEIELMEMLSEVKCVPQLLHSGVCRCGPYKGERYMALELQGITLSALRKFYIGNFSSETTLKLAAECIGILRSVHVAGILHRDIKPANFVVGRADSGRSVHIIDFGLSAVWLENGDHIPYQEGVRRCGTARYSSLNTHRRKMQSRRDDLEALGYMLIMLANGLPWKQKKGEVADSKWERILNEKCKWAIVDLVDGICGIAFLEFFKRVRELRFLDEPDYTKLQSIFLEPLKKLNPKGDTLYEWVSQ